MSNERKDDSQQIHDVLVRIETRLTVLEEKIDLIDEVAEFEEWDRRRNEMPPPRMPILGRPS